MPYAEGRMIKASMKPSPSLIYNNLTLCGGNLLYAHIRQACCIDTGVLLASQPLTVRKVDSQHSDVIHSIVACSHNAATFLVLATDAGIQIWDKTVTALVHVCPLPGAVASDVAPRNAPFARGVAINVANDGTPHICFGTSSGGVYFLPLSESDGKFKAVGSLPKHHTSPITAVGSAYQSRQGKWTEDLGCNLVTCDEDGGIAVWEGLTCRSGGYKLLTTIDPTGVPAVSVAMRRDLVVAARLDGAVQMYGMRDGKLRADLGAHSRFISAMEIHPTKDIIATVSEDCSLGVWALPIGGAKAECLLNVCWLHAMLTGVAFMGPKNDDVALVAYDTDEVHVYTYTS